MIRQDVHIRIGGVYTYTASMPLGCDGENYLVVDCVKDVPAYQDKLLIRCLSGPDKGLLFVVSPANFVSRYVPAEIPERVAGAFTSGVNPN